MPSDLSIISNTLDNDEEASEGSIEVVDKVEEVVDKVEEVVVDAKEGN